MHLDMKLLLRGAISLFLVALATPAFAQLGRTLDAHGGLEKWRAFAGVEYDLTWKTAGSERHEFFRRTEPHSPVAYLADKAASWGEMPLHVWLKRVIKDETILSQVEAFDESFRAAGIRFDSGVGNSIDYLTAKNNLDRANINLIIARYDYVLRAKILDYYQGKQLW